MTSYLSRPSGDTHYTPFEQELVNAMNDFVNSAEAPHFDTAAIARGARRKRATVITGVAAVLIMAGAGTALATSGSHTSRPATTTGTNATATDRNVTTVQYGDIPIDVTGFNLDMAKAELGDKAGLKIAVTKASPYGCKPTSVIAVSPHAPTVVHKGDTVTLTVCAG